MSINIFQFLKQGTSLNRNSLHKNKQLEEQIVPKPRTKNQCLGEIGKFHESDSSMSEECLEEEQMKKKHQRRIERNNRDKKMLQIKTEGHDIPDLMTNFTKMTKKYLIADSLAEGIAESGFSKPTPVQMQAIPSLIEQRNTLVTAPTGTGKTLAFSLPLIHNFLKHQDKKKIFAVIVAPLQQLSTQIMQQIQKLCSHIPKDQISIQCISKLTEKQKQKINSNKSPGFNFLVTTPMAFINTFAEHHKILKSVKYLILDQCDKYFEQSFVDQIRTIFQMFNTFKPIFGLFSATIQHPVEELLKTQLLDYSVRIQVGGKNKVLDKIDQSIEYCTNEYGKIVHLKNMISEGSLVPPAVIFVQQKKRAKQLFFQLKKINSSALLAGIELSKKIQVLTSEKSKQERQEILDKFELGQYWILITTDIVARGIDFKTVNCVINYDFPNSILTYIHRVGRTGRANRKGRAVTLFTDEDKPVVRSIANLLKVSGCSVPDWILEMPKPKKELKKKLEKHPVKRLPVGVAEGKDKNWQKQLDKLDKKWLKKKQKQAEKNKDEDSGEWIQC